MISWDNDLKVNIHIMKKNLICVYISDPFNNFWLFCAYGHPVLHRRAKVWKDMVPFASSINENGKWITIGDFNQAMSINDKIFFKKSTTLQGAEQLIECLNICKLSEIPPRDTQ